MRRNKDAKGKEFKKEKSSKSQAGPAESSKARTEPKKTKRREVKCFICSKAHYARDCPQRQALNALHSGQDSDDSSDEFQMGRAS